MFRPNAMPYVIIVGVLLVSLLAPLFLGADLWFVPLVVLPFAVIYLIADRRMARREERHGGH